MKGDVAGEPVELGYNDRTLAGFARRERCRQLRPSVEGIGSLAGLGLDELVSSNPSCSAKRVTAPRWASMPRPERPWRAVETR